MEAQRSEPTGQSVVGAKTATEREVHTDAGKYIDLSGSGLSSSTRGKSIRLEFKGRTVELPVVQQADSQPKIVTMTDLGQHAGEAIADVERGVPALVTKHGRFVAVIVPVDPIAFEDALFEHSAGPVNDTLIHAQRPARHRRRIMEFAADDSDRDEQPATVADVADELGLEDPSSPEDEQ